jgi:ApeA N-terminal domain 1
VNKRVEFVGQWWIPGEAGTPWSGRLVFDPQLGLELTLASTGSAPFPFWDPADIPVIQGFTVDGNRVTLTHCVQTRTNTHLPGGHTADYSASRAFVGAHFASPGAIAFDRMSFRLSDVGEWLGISGFESIRVPTTGFALKYEVPDDIDLADAPPFDVTVSFEASRTPGSQRARTLRELQIEQREWINMSADAPVPFDELNEVARQIRNFFCFVTRARVDFLDMRASAELPELDRLEGEPETTRQDVVVFYRPHALIEPRTRTPSSRDMLFTFADAKPGAESPLSRWLVRRDLLGPVYDLFLVSLYQPRIFLELQFLSLAQAIESLHSRKFPHYELPKAEYRERVREVVAAVPTKLKRWVKQKLAGGNRATFRQSLEELLATLPDDLCSAFGDVESFGKKLHVTRNYLTHWNPDLEAEAAKGVALVRVTMALKVILEALLLLELGFDCEAVAALLNRNERYKANVSFAIRER